MKLSKLNSQQKHPLDNSKFDYNSLSRLSTKAANSRRILHTHLDHLTSQFAKNKHIGVAVSGGSDSLCLLILAADWALLHGWKVSACTVDHGLRAAATLEANYVHQLCNSAGIDHDILAVKWPTNLQSKPTQTTARTARHQLLANWTRDKDISALLVGHTLDDRIETMLMRERSGSTDYGLAAMPSKSASPVWPDGRHLSILRPANTLSRKDLCYVLEDIGIQWVCDPSNENTKYERVRARLEIRSMSETNRTLIKKRLDELTQKRIDTNAVVSDFLERQTIWHKDGRASFNTSHFLKLADAIKYRILERILLCVSGTPKPVNISRVKKLLETIDGSELNTKSKVNCLGNCWIHTNIEEMQISLMPPKNKTVPKDQTGTDTPILIAPGQSAIFMGRFLVSLSHEARPALVSTWENTFKHQIKHGKHPDRICSNAHANRAYPVLIDADIEQCKKRSDEYTPQQLLPHEYTIKCLHEARKNHLCDEEFILI
ncbi:tRNA lysidine(34) synthetase TilS [Hirschia litorea]|uniref:tRNA(Ile)-lysidine synthase n=1 Tax=Hirschia litorea TaxID=1199156 RepID=A0ABW2IL87_9PROT